jgi:DNA-binding GntR family transcriptional regulator
VVMGAGAGRLDKAGVSSDRVMKRFTVAKISAAVPKNAQAYEQLKQALLYATFRAGEVLSIRTLAGMLGTSTMPVREAVTRLIAERALEPLPNRGVRVPILTPSQARDIFRVRFLLEGLAAELAASNITANEIKELEGYERDLERALKRDQVPIVVRANIQFHLSLYRASRSETVVALIEALYLRYAPSLYRVLESLPGPVADRTVFVHAHHSEILNALHSRNSVAARKALEADLVDVLSEESQSS